MNFLVDDILIKRFLNKCERSGLMFIVFGWGRQTIKNYGPVLKYHCDHCHNEKHWILYRRRTWFTLCFVPVIPYSTEYMMTCPVCNHSVKLDKKKFEEFKAIALCNTDLINNVITQEQHAARMGELLGSTADKSGDDSEWAGKTETQKNYLRQMREIEQERAAKASMSAESRESDHIDESAEAAGGE
jgi:hypothetical protein